VRGDQARGRNSCSRRRVRVARADRDGGELGQLICSITAINAWNRLAITARRSRASTSRRSTKRPEPPRPRHRGGPLPRAAVMRLDRPVFPAVGFSDASRLCDEPCRGRPDSPPPRRAWRASPLSLHPETILGRELAIAPPCKRAQSEEATATVWFSEQLPPMSCGTSSVIASSRPGRSPTGQCLSTLTRLEHLARHAADAAPEVVAVQWAFDTGRFGSVRALAVNGIDAAHRGKGSAAVSV
jgi:hypothetical protein